MRTRARARPTRARRGTAAAPSVWGSRRASSRSPCAGPRPPGRTWTSGRSARSRRPSRGPAPDPREWRESRSPLPGDATRVEEGGEAAERAVERHGLRPGLPVHGVDAKDAGLAIENGVDAPDQAIAAQNRQHVVAVLALRLRHVHLEPVVKPEQRLGPVTVVDEAVERGEKRRAGGHVAVARLRVHLPVSVDPADAERAPALLRQPSPGVGPGDVLDVTGVPALGEIPQPLLALPSDDGDDAATFEQLERERDLAAAPPVVRLARHHQVCLDLARQQRSAQLELAQEETLEARVRLQEFGASALVHRGAALAPHAGADERIVLQRPDERAPLEQLALLPQQAVELGGVVGAEPAPEDELLRRRDGRDRV